MLSNLPAYPMFEYQILTWVMEDEQELTKQMNSWGDMGWDFYKINLEETRDRSFGTTPCYEYVYKLYARRLK